MFIGGLNWETTDGNYMSLVDCTDSMQIRYESTLNSSERSLNVL